MSTRLKVGIVGTGHGLRTIAPALLSSEHFDIVAVAGSSISRTQEILSAASVGADAVDFEQIIDIDDIDLLCIASPNEFHTEHMKAAARKDVHLYLEKPIGNSRFEAADIAEEMASRPSHLMTVVGHQLRFNPFVRLIRDEWLSGSLGDVYSITIRQRGGAFASALRPWTWEFEKNRGGGVRLAMGTHLIDTVNFLSGHLPLSSHFFMDPVHRLRRPDNIGPDRFVDSSCFFSASLDYGHFGSLVSTSAASHGPGMFEIEVLGSTGTIYFDGVETLRIFSNGSLVDRSLPTKLLRSYVDRPGASIFRKSLSIMAEQMAYFITGRENDLGDASTVDEAIKILNVLDLGMDAFNARMSEKRNVF